jgi:beta-carotene 3-hydroxylase
VTSWIIGVAAFVAMEPLTYLAHRYVMHGPGMRWHASHHGPRSRGLERNDLFPVVFAVPTVAGMYAATRVPWLWWLFPIGAGVTAYGVVYALVHDVYAHRRLVRFRARIPGLEALAAAHRIHHRHGEEPYGFVVPIVPRRLREGRASHADRPSRPTADTGVEAA